MQPPKPKLTSYNAIANGSRRHTKKRLGTFSASGFWMILTCTTEHGFCSARHEMMLSLYVSILVYEMSNASMGVSGYLTQRTPADWAKTMAKAIPCKLESLQPKQAAMRGLKESVQTQASSTGWNPYSLVTMQRSHSMSVEEFKKEVKALMPQHASNTAPWPYHMIRHCKQHSPLAIPHDTTSHHIPCHLV